MSGFLTQCVPPLHVSEAVLDHDYTLLALRRYSEGAREFWSYTISGMKKMESTIIDPIRGFLQGDLRSFKVWLFQTLVASQSLQIAEHLI